MNNKSDYKSKNRIKKEETVKELTDKFSKATALVFTNYQGLTHQQLEELKRALKKVDSEFSITKNTLVKLALDDSKLPKNEDHLQQPTGTLFAYGDPVAPIKELAKKMKELQLPTVKFGILEGQEITENQVKQLATLPTKEVLLAQFVGGLKSPIFGLHRALNWNVQKLVMTLGAVAKTKTS